MNSYMRVGVFLSIVISSQNFRPTPPPTDNYCDGRTFPAAAIALLLLPLLPLRPTLVQVTATDADAAAADTRILLPFGSLDLCRKLKAPFAYEV